ncbi:MAG: hypothetical protein A2Y17_06985 [Clostridiales bacterium GWF2_38_85]|nr:MAG: hypothetical protein A2Y17_06985 [Clostridiales bacterium GWF2_38_85]HBL84962.1 ECF transporter S component [Clostridiales bacterium]
MKTNKNNFFIASQALFAALILLLTLVFGSIKIGLVEITFIIVPVAIGGMLFGPKSGALLGGVFGISSFLQCIMGTSFFGVWLLGINPFYTFILCVIPRILMGWLSAVIFKSLTKNGREKIIPYIIASICTPLFNTIFFVGTFALLFNNQLMGLANESGFNVWYYTIVVFVGINGLIEIIVSLLISPSVAKPLIKLVDKKF